MERETGIEPATSSLGSWRSTAELLPLSASLAYHSPAPVSIRTHVAADSSRWRAKPGHSCFNSPPAFNLDISWTLMRSSNSGSSRRGFLQTALTASAAITLRPALSSAREISLPAESPNAEVKPFDLEEITIADLQDGMKSGKFTARSLVEKYSARIDEIDKRGPAVNAIIEMNPDALSIAEDLDRERKAKGPRGPLHGIPVLIKDNIATADRMMTTAGSLALVGSKPPKDSMVAQKLRAAGAVILGKTNLSEWANIRSSHSTSGWSGRGGLTKNPYALDRNPCGSSSGSGVAVSANFCAAAIGTETDGSIVCPSHANGIVGIKPTVGLVSRAGIVPISHSQDGAGPMARTVADAALLLTVIAGK